MTTHAEPKPVHVPKPRRTTHSPVMFPWKDSEIQPALLQETGFYLGWIIEARGIRDWHAGSGFHQLNTRMVLPNWLQYKEPDHTLGKVKRYEDLEAQGLMLPDAWVVGRDHVMICIATNEPQSIHLITQKQFLEKNVLKRAFACLQWNDETFKDLGDMYENLVWVWRPPNQNLSKLNVPCIGKHKLPKLPGIPRHKRPRRSIPLKAIPAEMADIVTSKYLQRSYPENQGQ